MSDFLNDLPAPEAMHFCEQRNFQFVAAVVLVPRIQARTCSCCPALILGSDCHRKLRKMRTCL